MIDFESIFHGALVECPYQKVSTFLFTIMRMGDVVSNQTSTSRVEECEKGLLTGLRTVNLVDVPHLGSSNSKRWQC